MLFIKKQPPRRVLILHSVTHCDCDLSLIIFSISVSHAHRQVDGRPRGPSNLFISGSLPSRLVARQSTRRCECCSVACRIYFSETATLAPSGPMGYIFFFSTCLYLTCISWATCGLFVVVHFVDGLSLYISLFSLIHSLVLWRVRSPSADCTHCCCPIAGRPPSRRPRAPARPHLVKSPWSL